MSTTEPARGSEGARDVLAWFSDWDRLSACLSGVVSRARSVALSDEVTASFEAIEDEPGGPFGPLGRFADARFRGLVGATFAADLACYPAAGDQVRFDRLLDAMRMFPRGFRVWGARVGSEWLPLGYTGICPIAEDTFERFERAEVSLQGDPFAVLPDVEPGGSFLYVFNFSVVAGLRGTPLSARVVKAMVNDVAGTPHRGLAAITVSSDGERVIERFGMKPRGRGGEGGHETVFTGRTR